MESKPTTPSDYAGKWEMIKDTAGKEKRGLCLTIYPAGCCLVSAFCALSYDTALCRNVPSPPCAPSHSQPVPCYLLPQIVCCGVADKESMDKCCCPCMCAPMIPIGGGKYTKLCSDICVPMTLTPLEDGTIDGMFQGIYQKKPAKGAPPASEEMAR